MKSLWGGILLEEVYLLGLGLGLKGVLSLGDSELIGLGMFEVVVFILRGDFEFFFFWEWVLGGLIF